MSCYTILGHAGRDCSLHKKEMLPGQQREHPMTGRALIIFRGTSPIMRHCGNHELLSNCQQVKGAVCLRILPQRNVIKHLSPQVCIIFAALGCTRCNLQLCLCSVFLFSPSQSSKTKEDLGLVSRHLSN